MFQAYVRLLVLLTICGVSQANEPTIFSSGDQRVALIELFTSEGCSSCPPADRWLSGLKFDAGLWKDYVPVAFHVDYWNYIGWEDRFSRRTFSERQRRYAREGSTPVVYTPGFFRNGEDWRGWRRESAIDVDENAAGKLTVLIDSQSAEIHFERVGAESLRFTAHVALLGINLATSVQAGENNGRKLHHDFVALGLTSIPPVQSGTAYSATVGLPEPEWAIRDLAVAVWVSESGKQAPIQSVGGHLPSSSR